MMAPRKGRAMGPYSPPTPSEAERSERGEPMAVARDKVTPFDAAMPTGAPTEDTFSREVAERTRDPNFERVGDGVTKRRDENRAQEEPDGYLHDDEDGYRVPDLEKA